MRSSTFLTLRLQADDHNSLVEALHTIAAMLEADENAKCEGLEADNFYVQKFDYEKIIE